MRRGEADHPRSVVQRHQLGRVALMRRVASAVRPQPLEKRQADPFSLGCQPAGAGMGAQQEAEPGTALAIERHAAAVTEHAGTVPRARVAGI